MNGWAWCASGRADPWRPLFRVLQRLAPDFVKLAETFNMKGLVAQKADDLDGVITEMLETPGL